MGEFRSKAFMNSAPCDYECITTITDLYFQVKSPNREEWSGPTSHPAKSHQVFYTCSPELKVSGAFLELSQREISNKVSQPHSTVSKTPSDFANERKTHTKRD